MNLNDPDERAEACAQYALDIMDAAQRSEFEAAMRVDVSLAHEAATWRDRFHSLSANLEPVTPSPQLWSRIVSALPNARATVATRHAIEKESPLPFWQRVGVWRLISAVAVSCSIMLGSLLWLREPPPAVYIAILQSPQNTAGWMLQAIAPGKVRLVPLDSTQQVPDGKSLELWTQPVGASAPVSLGLVNPGKVIEIDLGKHPTLGRLSLNNVRHFAISLEPATGSPTGAPTGPVLFTGDTVPI